MTSRRGLMKLLAALPFAAPVVAKAGLETQVRSKIGRIGITLGEDIWVKPARNVAYRGEAVYGARIIEGPFICGGLATPTQPNEALRALLCGPARSDTPNRLYGVRINSDGDAV